MDNRTYITCKIHSCKNQIIEAKVIFLFLQNIREHMTFSVAVSYRHTEKFIILEYGNFRGYMKSPLMNPDTKNNLMIRSINEKNHLIPGLV